MSGRAGIDGLELEYEISGDGPDLVWLHGLGGNLETDRPTVKALARDFRVLSYSCRGCGRSTPLLDRGRYDYGRIAADLEALVDHCGFSQPILVGGSHGANTILRHEADFPGRARGLLLIAPGSNALQRPGRLKFALAIRAPLWWARRKGPDGFVRILAGFDPQGPSADPDVVAALRSHDPASLAVALRRIPDQRAVDPAVLPSFRVPTHVAAWDGDPLIHPIAVARRIATLIPGAGFDEVERPADLPPTELARRVRDLAIPFAERVLGSGFRAAPGT